MGNKSIGRRIADLRVDHDVRQGELAAALGLHQSVLNRIEHGQRPIRENEILGIARHFGVTTDYLLGNEPLAQETAPICTQSEKEHLRKYRAIGRENEKHVDALLDSFYRSLSTDGEKPQNR